MLTASCINRAYNNINGGHIMMTYATSSPAATTGGGQGNNNIPVSVLGHLVLSPEYKIS